ncbi:DNA-binding MarR family transcriptional regulator [Aeromicrobium panaciterrae]|uniref:DNA-binding MarR family transcriptional regulator n=1 Tax=Aeromicrobium panaciterrae TaxID=363861 RepID=A0ABU1ULB6_9ACTN|nr:MarR family transcriptional regulator [Aeromicrobium panaciterrae]MDR7085963.1 DNA-binding MarR family transcriptional regulator [Aeromicrobium panaciterrae]
MTTNIQLEEALQQFLMRCMSSAEAQGIDRLVELELSISQAKTVFVLAQAVGPLPIHQIAEQIRLSVAATGRNIDQLVKMGLVERKEDENDRRVKLVTITKAGHDVADQHLEARRTALRAMVSRLSSAEADQLHDALQPILAGEALRPTSQENS